MNLLLNRKFRAWLSLFAAAGLLAAVSAQAQQTTAADATSDSDKLVKLDKFEVTGSRIKRLDAETVSPVVQLTAQEITVQGFTTVGDALRAMPYNSGQALTPTDAGTSFTPGVSTMNLRGLGNNNTLVLINGRRGVPYAAPGFNGFQTMFDLNSIPAAAIESIEILKDGGSAMYGSDAVAGVVNVKLRRDYQGLTTSLEVGNYFDTDALYRKGAAVIGAATAKTSITTALSWEEQNAVFARDLSYSRNANKTEFKDRAHSYWSVTGFKEAGFDSEAAYLASADVGLTNPIDDGYLGNNSSSRGFPGRVTVAGKTYTFTSPTSTPTLENAIRGSNAYNFQQENGLFPEYRQLSFYTTVRHDISENLYAFAEVSYSRYQTQVYAASTPADLETSHGLTAGSSGVTPTNTPGAPEEAWGLHIPSYNPYNPWAVDIFSGRRRLLEGGQRTNDVTSDTPRLLAGLGGTFFSTWSWEAAAMYSKNTVDNLNRNSVTDSGLQQALMGLTRDGSGNLSWNPTTPKADRVYYNWFGLNEPAMSDFLTVENPTSAYIEYDNFDISASGPIFELPAGSVGMAIGAEHRQEIFGNVQTNLNATGNILGGSEGSSSYGRRDLTAVYTELEVPLLKNLPLVQSLELQLAARYEDYSDKGFARQARPKVGFKYRPLNWIIFRGSFAKSFKAPDMAYLYTASQTSFSSSQIHDPVTGGEIDQLQIVTGGNRNLKPELTDSYYGGISIAPTGALEGLNISVDYLEFKQSSLLAQLSDFYGYQEFISEAAAGNPLFAGKVVREAGTNEVLYIRDDYANISTGRYRGVDFDVSYLWKSPTLGNLFFGARATWIDRNEVDEDNLVGGHLIARWNATNTISWSKGDWGVTLFGVYRGRRAYHTSYGTVYDEGDELFLNYNVKAQYTQNVQVSYKGFRNLELTVGVNNVLNPQPPVDFLDGTGTTAGVNHVQPAFWYTRVEMKF